MPEPEPTPDGERCTAAPPLRVREATADDFVAAMRVLEGALLEVDASTLRARIGDGALLLAESDGGSAVGALVLDESRIEAVAVRRTYRRRGVGTALVAAAADRVGTVTAAFDPRVRPFYEALGFETEARDGRLWGRLER